MSEPLDLKAVETRLMRKIRHRSDQVLTIGCDTARDIEALLAHTRALRAELGRCARPITGDLALIAAAANDGLVCEPTLGIDNMRSQLLAIREAGRVGTERAAAVLGAAQDGPA